MLLTNQCFYLGFKLIWVSLSHPPDIYYGPPLFFLWQGWSGDREHVPRWKQHCQYLHLEYFVNPNKMTLLSRLIHMIQFSLHKSLCTVTKLHCFPGLSRILSQLSWNVSKFKTHSFWYINRHDELSGWFTALVYILNQQCYISALKIGFNKPQPH